MKTKKITIQPSKGWVSINFKELWEYRELLYFLIWRDIKVRYKQTVLGALWAILQPLLTMIVFSLIFGQLAKLPSDDIAYPIFTFTALLPWQLFAYAISQSGNSLIANQNLITKVYFPRLIIPMSAALSGLVDFGISFLVLLTMMIFYHIPLTSKMLVLPLFIILAIMTAFAVGLWLSALNVKYRDVRYTIPFLTQLWFFITPVAYTNSLIPDRWRILYALNPMVGVVEGFRWSLLGKSSALGLSFWISVLMVIIFLVTGLFYFRRLEKSFADIV